jgi:hypothetical protein
VHQQVSQKHEKLWLTSSVTSSLGISRNKTRTLVEIVLHLRSYEGNGTMLMSVRDRRIVCTQSKDGRHVAVVDWATATRNNLAVVPAINKAFSNMVDRVDRPNRPGRKAKAVPHANSRWCLLGTEYSICGGFGVNVQPTKSNAIVRPWAQFLFSLPKRLCGATRLGTYRSYPRHLVMRLTVSATEIVYRFLCQNLSYFRRMDPSFDGYWTNERCECDLSR